MFEIYVPLIAVNETGHRIDLCATDSRPLNLLDPKKSTFVNIRNLTKEIVKCKIKGFKYSKHIDLSIAGVDFGYQMVQNPDEKQAELV